MKILVSGSTGLIGSALKQALVADGHQVAGLVRANPKPGDVLWNPVAGTLNPAPLEGFDAVIHLAGDPIAEGRWNAEKKARIRDSRVKSTKLLAETLSKLARPPKVLLCASAVGIYGHRGEEVLKEDSSAGLGFLAEVGKAWEAAAEPAARKGIRVANLRFGIVLTPHGGALKKMIPPFKLGIGGAFGSGRQFISWIALEDAVGAIRHVLSKPEISGPVNIVAPEPVTNAHFSKSLGKALHRPAIIPMPAFGVRILFGEMADEALLASTRVEPDRLLSSGYNFRHKTLEEALRSMLN
jgi:uncharacterized protein (TIGR01777 family)